MHVRQLHSEEKEASKLPERMRWEKEAGTGAFTQFGTTPDYLPVRP